MGQAVLCEHNGDQYGLYTGEKGDDELCTAEWDRLF